MDELRKVLVGLVVESSIEATKALHELIDDYESKGETSVPIEELKECISKGMKEATKENSLTSLMMKE